MPAFLVHRKTQLVIYSWGAVIEALKRSAVTMGRTLTLSQSTANWGIYIRVLNVLRHSLKSTIMSNTLNRTIQTLQTAILHFCYTINYIY